MLEAGVVEAPFKPDVSTFISAVHEATELCVKLRVFFELVGCFDFSIAGRVKALCSGLHCAAVLSRLHLK